MGAERARGSTAGPVAVTDKSPFVSDRPPTDEDQLYREFGDRLIVDSGDLAIEEPPGR